MSSRKVLFIAQEMTPYVDESVVSLEGRMLPQALQEFGREIRTFMPKWGAINERRNQLHEVIRLSGMNIVIDDTDHPLIIKVASIPSARMQVYFIDNDDYFKKRGMATDADGKDYSDNMERAVFYARGVMETVKKLRWTPDVIYCQGWMSLVTAFYVKTAYSEEPSFTNAKVITAFNNELPDFTLTDRPVEEVSFRSANEKVLQEAGIDLTQKDGLARLAVAFSDGIVEATPGAASELATFAAEKNCPILTLPEEISEKANAVNGFIDTLLGA